MSIVVTVVTIYMYYISQLKRKWNDDVVFKNQSRDEPSRRAEFINDTIRNDFHRSFLKKYVR